MLKPLQFLSFILFMSTLEAHAADLRPSVLLHSGTQAVLKQPDNGYRAWGDPFGRELSRPQWKSAPTSIALQKNTRWAIVDGRVEVENPPSWVKDLGALQNPALVRADDISYCIADSREVRCHGQFTYSGNAWGGGDVRFFSEDSKTGKILDFSYSPQTYLPHFRACAIFETSPGERRARCDWSMQSGHPVPAHGATLSQLKNPRRIVVSAGAVSTCALDEVGTRCWRIGAPYSGQQDTDLYVPDSLRTDPAIEDISYQDGVACALTHGKVICWNPSNGKDLPGPQGLGKVAGLSGTYHGRWDYEEDRRLSGSFCAADIAGAGRCWRYTQKDGILVAMDFGTAAPLPLPGSPGSIDSSFGKNGRARTALDPIPGRPQRDGAMDFLPLADGRTLVIEQTFGEPETGRSVYRLLAEGSRDPSFGNNGRDHGKITLPGGMGLPTGYSALPDGSLIVALEKNEDPFRQSFRLYRVNSDGSPDVGFNQSAPVIETAQANVTQLVLQQDHKILVLVGGLVGNALFRFLPSGQPDLAFGAQGRYLGPSNAHAGPGQIRNTFEQVEVGPAGQILILGGTHTDVADSQDWNGYTTRKQKSFWVLNGPDGKLRTKTTLAQEWTMDHFKILSNGKIQVAGIALGGRRPILGRLNEDLSPDTSYGKPPLGSGILSVPEYAESPAFEILNDGTVYMAAASRTELEGTELTSLGLARFKPDGSRDLQFGVANQFSGPAFRSWRADLNVQPEDGGVGPRIRVRALPDGKVVVVAESYLSRGDLGVQFFRVFE